MDKAPDTLPLVEAICDAGNVIFMLLDECEDEHKATHYRRLQNRLERATDTLIKLHRHIKECERNHKCSFDAQSTGVMLMVREAVADVVRCAAQFQREEDNELPR